MTIKTTASVGFADTKPHYNILDGLRGAAALMVVWYHIFEGFAFAKGAPVIDSFNHGYLAVDFFFMLSGFVISYAYDDRWNGRMTTWQFFKRRLIRLHPMIIMGALIGTVTFLLQGGVKWDGTHTPAVWVLVAFLLTCLFLPAYPGAGYEIRGNGEMFPLNGPAWSLFFEYIGNVVYALVIRRLSVTGLTLLVMASGATWAWIAVGDVSGYGSMGVGWTLDAVNFFGGFVRMTFPLTFGMLLARLFRPVKVRGIFWMASIALAALFSVPYIPGNDMLCANGLYELFCVAIAFPILVWLGASGITSDNFSTAVCNWMGNISYPLYIVHYPVMYLFYAWLIDNKRYTLAETWPMVAATCAVSVLLAAACLKFYDIPVRQWLSRKIHVTTQQ